MLDLLRQSTGGLIAKTLIGLLVISFAVWGISGSILGGSGLNVVEVGDTKVDVYDFRFAYETQYSNFARQLQRPVTREEADALGLRQTVVSQLVAGAVLDENARKMGLGLSDENLAKTIGDDPNFNDLSGNFSREVLAATLRQVGMTEAEYVENRRDTAIRTQIIDGTAASLDLPEVFSNALSLYQNEKRVFEYVIIGKESVAETPVFTSADISGYFEENKSSYTAPEYRKIKLLKVQAADIAKPDEISNDEIAAVYEARAASFTQAEKRRIQQLVLKDNQEAEGIATKLAAGESFESILQELEKSEADVDLGLLEKSELPDQNLANAAFELSLNQPSDIVDGIFGPVILRVTEIVPESTKSLGEVEQQLREELALANAADEVFDTFDIVEDERNAGADLAEAAGKLGLQVIEIDAVDARGMNKEGNPVSIIPESQTVLASVFETEPGVETDAVELGSDGFAWFEVEEVIPQRQKTLDEVKSDVEAAWTNAQIAEEVGKKAENIAERIRADEAFNTVLAEALPEDSLGNAIVAETSDPLTRDSRDADISPIVLRQGFNATSGEVIVSPIGGVEHMVLRIVSADSSGGEIDASLVEQLNDAASQDILVQVVEDLQGREEIRINTAAMETALGNGNQHNY